MRRQIRHRSIWVHELSGIRNHVFGFDLGTESRLKVSVANAHVGAFVKLTEVKLRHSQPGYHLHVKDAIKRGTGWRFLFVLQS